MLCDEFVKQRLSALQQLVVQLLGQFFSQDFLISYSKDSLSAPFIASSLIQSLEKSLAAHQEGIIAKLSQSLRVSNQRIFGLQQSLNVSASKLRLYQEQLERVVMEKQVLLEQCKKLTEHMKEAGENDKSCRKALQKTEAVLQVRVDMCSQLQKSLAKASQRGKIDQQKIANLEADNKQLRERLQAVQKLSQKLRRSNELMAEAQQAKQSELRKSMAESAQRSKEAEQLRLNISGLNLELTRTRKRLQQQVSRYQSELSQSKQEKLVLVESIEKLKERVQQLESYRRRVEKQSYQKRNEGQEVPTISIGKDKRLQRLQEENQHLRLSLQSAQQAARQIRQSDLTLQHENEQLRMRIRGLQQQNNYEHQTSRRIRLESDAVAKQKQLIDIQQQVVKAHSQRLAIEKQLFQQRRQCETLKTKLLAGQSVKASFTKACDDLKSFNSEVQKLAKAKAQLTTQNEENKTEINRLRGDIARLQKQLGCKEELAVKIEAERALLQNQNKLLKERHNVLLAKQGQSSQSLVNQRRQWQLTKDQLEMRSKALLDEIAVAKEEVRQLSYINEDLRKKLNEGERQADIEKEQLDRQVEQLQKAISSHQEFERYAGIRRVAQRRKALHKINLTLRELKQLRHVCALAKNQQQSNLAELKRFALSFSDRYIEAAESAAASRAEMILLHMRDRDRASLEELEAWRTSVLSQVEGKQNVMLQELARRDRLYKQSVEETNLQNELLRTKLKELLAWSKEVKRKEQRRKECARQRQAREGARLSEQMEQVSQALDLLVCRKRREQQFQNILES